MAFILISNQRKSNEYERQLKLVGKQLEGELAASKNGNEHDYPGDAHPPKRM